MSRRIAHRPRYRSPQANSHFSIHTPQAYLRTRWIYRKQTPRYQARVLGQGLRLLHFQRPWHELAVPFSLISRYSDKISVLR